MTRIIADVPVSLDGHLFDVAGGPSSPPESVRTKLDWTFVTTGLPDAVTAARVIPASTATHLTCEVSR